MSTNLRRFKRLALRTMARGALKDDVNDTKSIVIEDFDDVLHVCGFVLQKSVLCRTPGL